MKTDSHQEPLAPFNNAEPFELAVLAVLLSKGKDPAKHLPAAASLWALAYQYREDLRFLFWGEETIKRSEEMLNKMGIGVTPQPFSFGTGDEWIDVKTACAKYSWGKKHLRNLLAQNLPAHIFKQFWKTPIGTIRLPKTLLDKLDKLQAKKRAIRSQKAVKPR